VLREPNKSKSFKLLLLLLAELILGIVNEDGMGLSVAFVEELFIEPNASKRSLVFDDVGFIVDEVLLLLVEIEAK
jgi:hypothetical protein